MKFNVKSSGEEPTAWLTPDGQMIYWQPVTGGHFYYFCQVTGHSGQSDLKVIPSHWTRLYGKVTIELTN
jgi:hypothetical protein